MDALRTAQLPISLQRSDSPNALEMAAVINPALLRVLDNSGIYGGRDMRFA